MDTNEIINILKDFGLWRRSFTPRELVEFVDRMVDCELVQRALLNDRRFVSIGKEVSGECFFIAENTLFRWFTYLSLRLARARIARLSSRQLMLSMSSLRLHGQWDSLLAGVVDFGCQLGFIAPAWKPGYYVFPLAHLLSRFAPFRIKIAKSILENLADKDSRDNALREPMEYQVEKALSNFDGRMADVIKQREGLLTGVKATLEQIGFDIGVTRERVRQIELEFWESRKLSRYPKVPRFFVKGLLCEIMRRRGSLLIDAGSLPLMTFIAKCICIPYIEVPDTGLTILGATQKDIVPLRKLLDNWTDLINIDSIAARLGSGSEFCFSMSDMKNICEKVLDSYQKRLTKVQRVNLVLRSIGRPVHYSEVTAEYNHLFPDDPATEYNIHAILSREEHGIVWIGAKGMFALEEWGYHRPSKTLFDTVTEIVERIYKITDKPVPFAVIVAEISKYRKFVNLSSLTIAAHCNPKLRRVLKDFFIPRDPSDQIEDEISADELDEILREFEEED